MLNDIKSYREVWLEKQERSDRASEGYHVCRNVLTLNCTYRINTFFKICNITVPYLSCIHMLLRAKITKQGLVGNLPFEVSTFGKFCLYVLVINFSARWSVNLYQTGSYSIKCFQLDICKSETFETMKKCSPYFALSDRNCCFLKKF